MNDQLEQALAQLVDKINAGGTLVGENLPIMVQDTMRWAFVESLTFFIIAILLMVAVVIALYWSYKENKKYDHNEELVVIVLLISLVVSIFSVPCLLINTTWIQILVSPNAWLLSFITRSLG